MNLLNSYKLYQPLTYKINAGHCLLMAYTCNKPEDFLIILKEINSLSTSYLQTSARNV